MDVSKQRNFKVNLEHLRFWNWSGKHLRRQYMNYRYPDTALFLHIDC